MSCRLLVTGVNSPQYRTRQSLLQRMLSPLLSHQTVPVYPPPAQYNDYSGYSIPVPPPHFSVPKVNLTINARSDHGEQAMRAIIVHRFVQQNVNSNVNQIFPFLLTLFTTNATFSITDPCSIRQ